MRLGQTALHPNIDDAQVKSQTSFDLASYPSLQHSCGTKAPMACTREFDSRHDQQLLTFKSIQVNFNETSGTNEYCLSWFSLIYLIQIVCPGLFSQWWTRPKLAETNSLVSVLPDLCLAYRFTTVNGISMQKASHPSIRDNSSNETTFTVAR